MWDYDKFVQTLKSGNANYSQELAKLGGVMGSNAQNVYREILAQQAAGTAGAWYAGNTASPEAAAANFALRLAENGIGSLTELGQRSKDTVGDWEGTPFTIQETERYNKTTGEPLPRPDLLQRGTRDLGIDYQIQFAPDGSAVPFTTERVGSGESFVKEALIPGALLLAGAAGLSALTGAGAAGGGGGLLGGAGAGAGAATGAGATGGAGGLLGGAGLTAEQLAVVNALGGAEAAGGLTAAQAASAGLGGGFPAAAAAGMTAEQLAAANALGGAEVAGGLTTTQAAAAGLGGGFNTVTDGLLNSNIIKGGLNTVAGLLQSDKDRAAAEAGAASINAATQQAVQGAQFRPIGTTTRFGSSNFQYDPVTGQMTGAGYQLSPEAKAAQDRFAALVGQGITQAEGAQKAFSPLETGAQSLFGLGNQYLAQSPQSVAQNYIDQQMALLKPGRELELANLQNRLQQQGRGGLSVAQGGTFGATTPELQALYNARAQQDALLAANAQQAGQQNVTFGAGLLGTGAQTLGNYYAGQQAAYSPYTSALGQVTGIENLGQQPFALSTGLANQVATAGANAGRLGLAGAGTAANISTGRAATTDPFASLLAGFGGNDALAKGIQNIFGR
jgi:hypothetical protein